MGAASSVTSEKALGIAAAAAAVRTKFGHRPGHRATQKPVTSPIAVTSAVISAAESKLHNNDSRHERSSSGPAARATRPNFIGNLKIDTARRKTGQHPARYRSKVAAARQAVAMSKEPNKAHQVSTPCFSYSNAILLWQWLHISEPLRASRRIS